ncbi:MAG: hypothetical protein COX81_02710, partial [Candidatus Magasanikbacteria bacterium CG_4_10_14_0_2_um_filter_37_12]
MHLGKIKNKAHRLLDKLKLKSKIGYIGYILLGVVVVFFVFGLSTPVLAQGWTYISDGLLNWATRSTLAFARLCIGFTIFALKFFIEIAKYNNYIDVPTVKLGWLMVRDLANMFFVVALLFISFGTILGIEQYEWKKTLVKLIIAAVFINFSNMIAQLFIDVAHVFTITFVNAISATAGGNLINMFNISEVYKMTGEAGEYTGDAVKIELFVAAVAAFALSLVMAVTMAAYLVIMLARMVALWVLIIVSPLAYVLQVIPSTADKAKEYWKEFANYVIAAPMMVFFLWLAFATLSTNNVVKNELNIQMDGNTFDEAEAVLNTSVTNKNEPGKKHALSISEATTWENLAGYLVSIAFLLVGLREVQKLNVEGSGVLPGIKSFATDVAKFATGYGIGKKIFDRGAKRVNEGVEGVSNFVFEGAIEKPLMNFPAIGGKSWVRTGKRIQEFRRHSAGFRKIPFFGKYNEEYQEKLDERVEKTHKMQKDTRMKDMSKTGETGISAIPVKGINWLAGKVGLGVVDGGEREDVIDKKTGEVKLDKDGNKVTRAKRAGIIGLGALTARRNYAEYQEMAAIQMRSPTAKKVREAHNRERLLNEGTEMVVQAEDGMFGEWLEKNHGVSGYKKMSADEKKVHRDAHLGEYRADEGERKKLDKYLGGDINKAKPTMWGLYGKDEGTHMRAKRNAAAYVFQKEKAESMEAKVKADESKAKEAVTVTGPGQSLVEDLADAEVAAGIGAEIVKQFKNAHLEKQFEKALKDARVKASLDDKVLSEMGASNPFIESLRVSNWAKEREGVAGIAKGKLDSLISGATTDRLAFGTGTFTDVKAKRAKQIGNEKFTSLDEGARGDYGTSGVGNALVLTAQSP